MRLSIRERAGRAHGVMSVRAGLVLSCALALAACSSPGTGGSDAAGPMGGWSTAGDQGAPGSQMETTTVASTAAAPGTPGALDPNDYECPPVSVRPGAATWQVADSTGLRYQGTLGKLARECNIDINQMKMRVGIEGRMILGPKGAPGPLTVPLRIAVVHEGPNPKPIWTRLVTVPVEFGASETQVSFANVVEDVAFPIPTPSDSEKYVVYVGFDPQGAAPAAKPKPARPKPVAPKPVAAKPKPVAPEPAEAQAPAPAPARQAPAPAASGGFEAPPQSGFGAPPPSGFGPQPDVFAPMPNQ